jgi:nucleoside-diphosphate-sugar epimerase
MSHFTVLGAQGFIGSRLVAHLRDEGHRVTAPPRHAEWTSEPLGHVIYAAGVTHDFAARPFDTVAAHVSRLSQLLAEGSFDSLVYLSSTRVYQGLTGMVDEAADLSVNPTRPGDLYNLSKLAGESAALHSGRPAKVVRLSNVYDASDRSQAFLPAVLRAAAQQGAVTFHSGPESTRDYVSLRDVVSLLPRIALRGEHTLYNLASGRNVTHRQLADQLIGLTGCRVGYAADADDQAMPQISICRLIDEFDFRPAELFDDLPQLLAAHGAQRETVSC